MDSPARIGVVADDYTGASDASSFLQQGGAQVILYNRIPVDITAACNAAVIALKSRTEETSRAVADTLAAADRLKAYGADTLYFKYCSTFDSTPRGNIGPVLDTLLERYNIPYTLLCPALPVNGRTVRDGVLYVNGLPLAQSHMKDHPLTPMWDSHIAHLMRPQSKYPCYPLSLADMQQGREHIQTLLAGYADKTPHFYLIPDYYEDAHGDLIASLFGDLALLSGGSALLRCCARRQYQGTPPKKACMPAESAGKTLLLSGSCSSMTLRQVKRYQDQGGQTIRIYPADLAAGTESIESVWQQLSGRDQVLLYSSAPPEEVLQNQRQQVSPEHVSALLEQTTAALARMAREAGYDRIIVAGGETSGAVVQALGYDCFLIGPSVAPGVPVMTPLADPAVRIVLKSGNFGDENFFQTAIEVCCNGG